MTMTRKKLIEHALRIAEALYYDPECETCTKMIDGECGPECATHSRDAINAEFGEG